jgi:hypothetical protein
MMSTKNKVSRQPPAGAPEGTIWFGGPVDRFKITLRIRGDELNFDRISALLGCRPTKTGKRGARAAKGSRWELSIESKDCDAQDDVEEGIKILLARLPSETALWTSLTTEYSVDLFCGLFMESSNRGFGISAETSRMLSDRHLEIGFDLYFDLPH